MSLQLDHVLIAVADLDAAGLDLQERHGLASVEGGRHPGWGTANRIVPLGDAYLELIAVVDPAEAAQSAFGSWVAATEPGPFAWAVRTDDLDRIAGRLRLVVGEGSRTGKDGRSIRWRIAGVEHAAAEPSLPFFIEWAAGTRLPGQLPATHRLEQLRLSGDAGRLGDWLGLQPLPVSVQPGVPAVTAALLSGGVVLT